MEPYLRLQPPDREALRQEGLAAVRREAESRWRPHSLRPLTEPEIARLVAQRNSAENWNSLRVVDDFSTDQIFGNRFSGRIELGRFDAGAGVFDSFVADSTICSGVRLACVGRARRVFFGEGSTVEWVDRIEAIGGTISFGNGLELFQEELFSRRLICVAGLPWDWAVWITSPQAAIEDPALARELNDEAAALAREFEAESAFVAPGARVFGARAIENCWIGPEVEIDAAGSLRNCTLWGAPGERTFIRDGSNLRNAIIGPGCVVENNSFIENSILFEHVNVAALAIVKGSAVAANSRLGGSECNDSLLGPFTMAIHHGVILAAWWPEGKGNVAYGSNVGSNHTGKAPDQELHAGEGLFFGLGCSVKYPSNFREAPFTIIASGLTTLPQRVSFPYSLIAEPMQTPAGLSPALNEIHPGWLLANNAYGLERQERNLRHRLRARRTAFPLGVLRPSLIDAIEAAALRLEVPEPSRRDFYTEKEIPGLGKNFMTEDGRRQALDAYAWAAETCADRWVILALLARLSPGETSASQFGTREENLPPIFWRPDRPVAESPEVFFDRALAGFSRWVEAARTAKRRDDRRGSAILDDYSHTHRLEDDDPLIRQFSADLMRCAEYRSELISLLSAEFATTRRTD